VVAGLTLAFRDAAVLPTRVPDFSRLLGPAAWQRLPAAVLRRFANHANAIAVYRGRMRVSASRIGRMLAHVCRLIGTPVAPYEGPDVPVSVRVYDRPDKGGTVWERRYEFPGRAPTVVSSTKQLDDDGGLVEALSAGLHMRLAVFEKAGVLHFVSTGYFFRIGRLRIALPDWFLPGTTHVVHEDRGSGEFRFALHTEHPRLGEMFHQDGIFT
jgi:Domain of unknown function (DUF4166)